MLHDPLASIPENENSDPEASTGTLEVSSSTLSASGLSTAFSDCNESGLLNSATFESLDSSKPQDEVSIAAVLGERGQHQEQPISVSGGGNDDRDDRKDRDQARDEENTDNVADDLSRDAKCAVPSALNDTWGDGAGPASESCSEDGGSLGQRQRPVNNNTGDSDNDSRSDTDGDGDGDGDKAASESDLLVSLFSVASVSDSTVLVDRRQKDSDALKMEAVAAAVSAIEEAEAEEAEALPERNRQAVGDTDENMVESEELSQWYHVSLSAMPSPISMGVGFGLDLYSHCSPSDDISELDSVVPSKLVALPGGQTLGGGSGPAGNGEVTGWGGIVAGLALASSIGFVLGYLASTLIEQKRRAKVETLLQSKSEELTRIVRLFESYLARTVVVRLPGAL